MSELAYHRKYRPNTLSGYIGNDRLKETALASLRKSKRPQVILLEGNSGCGKTTFARLLAKEYLCENRDLETGACNECMSCQELDDYIQTGDTSVLANVREVDIADQSGKKDIDVVLEEMLIPAFGDQWRVFIFDEVHMATPQAQNRMLKIAEEPPDNVLMIFCTTNPEMLLETLKNRCQLRLRVRKPTVVELGGLLKKVCQAEEVDCDTKGVNFIALRSDLTIRKALTSLEQVVTERGNATYESAIGVFEEVADTLLINFYKKLIGVPEYDSEGKIKRNKVDGTPIMKRDILGYVTLLSQIKSKFEFEVFVNNLIDFTKKGIYIINQVSIDGISDGELVTYRDLFSTFTVEQMAYLIDRLLDLLKGTGDLETKLLWLGYTGIVANKSQNIADNTTTSSLDSGLDIALNEVAMESKRGTEERTLRQEKQEQDGIKRAEELAKPASLDDIRSIFGNVDISLG